MKIYRGMRSQNGNVVTVTSTMNNDQIEKKLNPRFDLRNHSPTGFEWGYGGSGPAQLALAILADHTDDSEKTLRYYQDFKFKVIGRLNEDKWTLTSQEVEKAFCEIQTKTIRVER